MPESLSVTALVLLFFFMFILKQGYLVPEQLGELLLNKGSYQTQLRVVKLGFGCGLASQFDLLKAKSSLKFKSTLLSKKHVVSVFQCQLGHDSDTTVLTRDIIHVAFDTLFSPKQKYLCHIYVTLWLLLFAGILI